jgi:preprotein translocase subunit SecD
VAAPTGHIKAARYFAALAILLAVLYALVFFTGDKKPTPKLGLDLQGGTSMTLSAVGGTPSRDRLDLARQIISDRVDLSGVSEPSVVVDGDRNIVVQVAGLTDSDTLRKLVAPAQLRFRQVLDQTEDKSGDTGQPSASASPQASASGSAQTSGSAAASGSAKPSASASANAAASTSASPAASAAPSGSPAASDAAREQMLAAAIKKLGVVYQYAQSIQSPASVTPEQEQVLQVFTKLSSDEIAALPPDIQFKVPTISCHMLDNRPIGSVNDAGQSVVACGKSNGAPVKYMLDQARVVGEDVGGANFYNDPTNGWSVGLQFKGAGQDKWTKLTKDVYGTGSGSADDPKRKVAIVLDNVVVSAPVIQAVIPGDAQIYGTFTKAEVETLSRQLKYGSLPLAFNVESVDTVSATIGLDALRAGLLAGAIGLALVIVYCMFYYRALGLVVILSLLVSAALVYATLVLLGRGISYSLGLAGVAGFIVAIGITADSFVVFFERLKDEVKDGRTVRSSVPRAWARARRTILSADTVSLLAAAVLYVLAVGGVKGFAFTLGMSTIIDLVVVFLFTHPLVSVLSGFKAFTSPRFSGLGNLRPDKAAATPTARPALVRTKES